MSGVGGPCSKAPDKKHHYQPVRLGTKVVGHQCIHCHKAVGRA